MSKAGDIVFGNLPIIFAIGVAIGMAKKEKEVAALSAAIAFFIMHASINALITITGGAEEMLSGATASVVGITSLQMGVFGGIIVGLGVAALHNRFYKIELPQVLSFFGGTRFVPIISALVYTGVGLVYYPLLLRLLLMTFFQVLCNIPIFPLILLCLYNHSLSATSLSHIVTFRVISF